LLHSSNKINEHILDYTDCLDVSELPNNVTCASQLGNFSTQTCMCSIPFILPENFDGKVYMYYGLSNYYQNHRRYAKSRDDDQLLGILSNAPSDDCDPFQYDGDDKETRNPIAPCGAIANSMFSDTLSVKWNDIDDGKGIMIPLVSSGIAWPSDIDAKFRNPGDLTEALRGYVPPLSWKRSIADLNNGFRNEDFIVWMRTAALPNFRKLYRSIDHSNEYFEGGLKQGNYTLEVEYQHPVKSFNGRKLMILSTLSILGGKNPFLGISYIVVGCVSALMGAILLFIHMKFHKNTT